MSSESQPEPPTLCCKLLRISMLVVAAKPWMLVLLSMLKQGLLIPCTGIGTDSHHLRTLESSKSGVKALFQDEVQPAIKRRCILPSCSSCTWSSSLCPLHGHHESEGTSENMCRLPTDAKSSERLGSELIDVQANLRRSLFVRCSKRVKSQETRNQTTSSRVCAQCHDCHVHFNAGRTSSPTSASTQCAFKLRASPCQCAAQLCTASSSTALLRPRNPG